MTEYNFFPFSELACQKGHCPYCGGKADMDHEFMELLVDMRVEAGFPFPLSSAYRCPEYNSRVSDTGRNGPHTTGKSVDVKVYGKRAHRLMCIALASGITGIGIMQKGPHEGRFLHLDTLTGDTRPWPWSY